MDRSCPYRTLPPIAVWRNSVAGRSPEEILPLDPSSRLIDPDARIASAGSCFAQRIAENLADLGLSYFVTEPGPEFLLEDERRRLAYGTYTARYGNIYTALQLLQLVERAYGDFEPEEALWQNSVGRYTDPFRPGIHGPGFRSESECRIDREQHFAAVRRMFEAADVFLFTLGLTEAWTSIADGAVFPVCPGCGHGGSFDQDRYRFVNFGVAEVVQHLDQFIRRVRGVNPRLRIVLTVSPVPLIATFSDQHVLPATVYSKSVLRVACEEIRALHPDIDYFASYEIVQNGGGEWAYLEDRRSVSPEAVAQVIECFRAQFVDPETCIDDPPTQPGAGEVDEQLTLPRPDPLCDEEQILAAMARERL